jgi:hypothetical protein
MQANLIPNLPAGESSLWKEEKKEAHPQLPPVHLKIESAKCCKTVDAAFQQRYSHPDGICSETGSSANPFRNSRSGNFAQLRDNPTAPNNG